MTLKELKDDNKVLTNMIIDMFSVIEGGDAKLDFEHNTFAFNLIDSLSDFLDMKLHKIEQHIENQKLINELQNILNVKKRSNILDAKFGKDRKLK